MHLTSTITLLFHGAFLILSHKMQLTGLDWSANIVFLHFHMHYYFGYTAIPPVHYFTLWLAFKLWAVLTAFHCLHSWENHSLNFTQELGFHDTERKEGPGTQPCVREHSIVWPNIHPWSTNREGLGREPDQQGTRRYNCRGRRWRTNHHPLLFSLTRSTVDPRACIHLLAQGRGALRVLCPAKPHFYCKTRVKHVKFLPWLVFPTV